MKYLITLLFSILIFSCKTSVNEDSTTYFGGEVVNPRAKYVLFLKDDVVIDTILLNNKNRFLAEFKDLDEGLYTFKHGLEFQYIYLEPADSVLVRLNSWDFDESIVYSGKGSSKNEFLINLFLQNELEEKAMYQFFSLDEKLFQKKLDSLTKVRNNIYEGFTAQENSISEGFDDLINVAINYPLFRLKEAYPYYYKNAHKLRQFPEVSEEFYAFRKKVDLNKSELLSFYPYQNYVINYLYNLSYLEKEKDSTKSDLTLNVLNTIIEKIPSEEIKNTLLKRVTVNDFLKSEASCTINSEKLNVFLENCTNEDYLNQVQQLVNDSKFVENNKPLPNFDLISYNGTPNAILNVVKNKKAVIYFWSTEYMSADYLVARIKYLEKKYPNILFIGVQMQPGYINMVNDPKLKSLDIDQQYKLTPTSFANDFLTSRYPRIIIVENNSLVMNGFTYLDSKSLHKELNKIQKK